MIPQVKVAIPNLHVGTINRKGSMCNAYSPFKNLQDEETRNLGNFTTEKLNFDLQHPVDIIPQDSYDGSVNLILNDGKNQPRLIGSRFSVIDNGQFKITDHTGFKDTNIYDSATFDIDTSLKTIALKIPKLEFKGLTSFAGSLQCGAYTFYFKLSDADGNESEVLAESGIVQMYIGESTPKGGRLYPDGVRMGTEDENTGKSVSFSLTNIDSGFDYVHVLYARSSSSNDQAASDTYHKIVFDYPVVDGKADITITGKEQIIGISAEELYVNYADLEAVRTQSVVNNVLFFGNLVKKERDWDAMRIASWKILPSVEDPKKIVGSIDRNYTLNGPDSEHIGGYYNPYNVYYRVGYWPDEIYRFGVVYIFNDNSLSPVFNVPGVDFTIQNISANDLFDQNSLNTLIQREAEPDDWYFDKRLLLNSRGVIKFPAKSNYEIKGGVLYPKPLAITFNIEHIGHDQATITYDDQNTPTYTYSGLTAEEFFKENDIKGLFFVRQKRIPTILAQGLAIGLTKKDFGAIPVIKEATSYTVQSFLGAGQVIWPEGTKKEAPTANVSINAMLVPDAEMNEATYNQLFVSNKHALQQIGQYSFFGDNSFDRQYTFSTTDITNRSYAKRKLCNVPEDTKTLTDGEVYFSTLAGNPDEPYKTVDVENEWNKTKPQDLTSSETLIRGKWGPFVGVGEKISGDTTELQYGKVYNIKLENYYDDEKSATELDFQRRMNSAEQYRAICDRTQVDNIIDNTLTCYRGDCFVSLFTHRMFRNFADPELPTNTKIINPLCWAQNYAVRCTAIADVSAVYNVYPENDGWKIGKQTSYANEIVQAFEVKDTSETQYKWDPDKQQWYIPGDPEDTKEKRTYLTGTIGGTSRIIDILKTDNPAIKVIKPAEQEQSGVGGVLKNIFKSSLWAVRGLSGINRADVNAVGLGQWITFPICSSKNLAFRDVDYSNATEQAAFNRKRSFFPLEKMDIHNPLRDSNVINQAAGISLPHKAYYAMPNVPFIKQEYFTRIINSLRDSSSSITNEFKVMLESAYKDYTKIHGSITKLMPLGSKMLVVFEHGIGILALNDQMSQAENALQFLPAELNMVVSPTYGSLWKDSIIETQGYIYGLDSVAKVIWRVDSNGQLQIISQMKVEKFLIDNLEMSEFSKTPYVGHINIKAHYNAFKHDVMFTYYNDILYKFDASKYENIPLSDWQMDSEGYLLNEDGSRTEYHGVKVEPEYDQQAGIVKTYKDIIEEIQKLDSTYPFKWYKGKSWSLCFNELIGKFTTFYDWIPLESENIDNIWFSFDREAANKLADQGFSHSFDSTIQPSPITSRDTKYSKNAIDKAFNTTCAVNYFNNFTTFTVAVDTNPEMVTACGFYLHNGKYDIIVKTTTGIPVDSKSISVDGWQFIAVLLKYSNNFGSTNPSITITINNTNETTDSNLAVTDLIRKVVNNTSWYSRIDNDGIIDVPTDLSDYYIIRDLDTSLKLWKHGQAGVYDNAEYIRPTHWYGQQHEFNFEFIARKDAMHKIFNNLQIISNKTEPHKFEFEVVGEVYDWHKYKAVLKWIADHVPVPLDHKDYEIKLNDLFVEVLKTQYGVLKHQYSDFPIIFGMKNEDYFEKLPYLRVTDACVPTLDPQIIGEKKGEKDKPDIYLTPEQQGRDNSYDDNTVSCCLVYDRQLNEFRVHTEQLGNDVWKYGRLRGNMQYLEDLWRIEIRPVAFKYAYLEYNIDPDEGRLFTIQSDEQGNQIPLFSYRVQETRHRDKYIKIKVRYTGEDLAVIQAINTLFDYSYA